MEAESCERTQASPQICGLQRETDNWKHNGGNNVALPTLMEIIHTTVFYTHFRLHVIKQITLLLVCVGLTCYSIEE